jgi:hypothetical protein
MPCPGSGSFSEGSLESGSSAVPDLGDRRLVEVQLAMSSDTTPLPPSLDVILELVSLAREAVRAYYLASRSLVLEEAMDKLAAAFVEVDGIDYRVFAAGEEKPS